MSFRYYKITEVAEIMSLSEECVRQLIANGDLPSVKIGPKQGSLRISETALEKYAEARPREVKETVS